MTSFQRMKKHWQKGKRTGFKMHLIDGPSQNIKITTPEDFYTMRAILEAQENEQIYGFEN